MPIFHKRYLVGKRAFDLAICLLLLPLAIVLSLACAIAILVDSRGPDLYRAGTDWARRQSLPNVQVPDDGSER